MTSVPEPPLGAAGIVKLRALAVLVPCVVHRLNNALVGIRGTCEIAEETGSSPDYDVLRSQAQVLTDGLAQLAHLAREPQTLVASERVAPLLERITALLRPLFDERKVPILHEPSIDARLEGPIAMLEQHLLLRLASLALTQRPWGPVRLGVEGRGTQGIRLTVRWEAGPEHVAVLADEACSVARAFDGSAEELGDTGFAYDLAAVELLNAAPAARPDRAPVVLLAPDGEQAELLAEVLAEDGWPVQRASSLAELSGEARPGVVLFDGELGGESGSTFDDVRAWCHARVVRMVLLAADSDPRPASMQGVTVLGKPIGPVELLAALDAG